MEQVCSGPGLRPDQVLDLLTALADKSLLTVRQGSDGASEPRYRMLEIIRAYGQERLAEAGERDVLRQAHARYFIRLAEASQDHLLGARQLDWLRRLADDQDNLHAAIRGAVAAGDARTAVGLAGALGWYWSLRSMKVEGAELIAEAVGVPGAADTADPERLAVAYAMGGLLAADTPMRDTGVDWFGRAARLAARIPDPVSPIMPLIGPLSRLFGAIDPARGPTTPQIFDDAAAHPHPWVSAIARILRAHAALNLGRQHARAEADFLAAAGILATLGERWGQAVALGGLASLPHVAAQLRAVAATGLGYLAGAEGDLDAARDWHARALEAARAAADAPVIAEALAGLADLALREADPERAAELLGASVAIRGTQDRSVQDDQRVADAARATLGEAAYRAAYQRGREGASTATPGV